LFPFSMALIICIFVSLSFCSLLTLFWVHLSVLSPLFFFSTLLCSCFGLFGFEHSLSRTEHSLLNFLKKEMKHRSKN
jgi:hypothetical protein